MTHAEGAVPSRVKSVPLICLNDIRLPLYLRGLPAEAGKDLRVAPRAMNAESEYGTRTRTVAIP